MSNHFDQVKEATKTDVLNIYLDFEKNGERLLGYLKRLKHLHGERLLPDCRQGEDLLKHFVGLVFPEGLIQTYYFSNTSLKKGLYDITIRPCIDGPRLERVFPGGLVLCVRGHPSPPAGRSPVLVIDRIVDISDSDVKRFEVSQTAVAYTREENVYRKRRGRCLFTPEFIENLPLISQETHERLKDWRGYLGWKKRIIESNLAGIRYLSVDLTEVGVLRFLTICENKDAFNDFRRHLPKDDLMAFETGYSKHSWIFDHNEEHQGRPRELGEFSKAEEIELLPTHAENVPWRDPHVACLLFELSEDARNDFDELRLENGREDSEQYRRAARDVREAILTRFPKTGFLALSAVGEKVLVKRQGEVLKRLEEQSGYSPFLSSYLFDMNKANLPAKVSVIETWHNKTLNSDQKKAVQVILAAPDLAMVQGPPGTGKTTVIAESVYQFARQGKKVLIASQANLAVDNVLEQLAETPAIRAVRLGKKEKIDEGLQLTKDNVLKVFYRSLAKSCRQRYLEPWKIAGRQIAELERWIQDADVVHKDIGTFEEKLQADLDHRRKIQQNRDSEEKRLSELYEENQQKQRQKDNLEHFKRFLAGKRELEFLLPKPILDVIHKRIVRPLDGLVEAGIEINQLWHVKEAESPGRRSFFARQILAKWQEVLENLPQMQNDLARLQRLPTEQIIDLETASELEDLRKQIEQVQEAMIDDDSQFEIFKELKKRERELKRKSSGLDPKIYSKIFTGLRNNVPCWQKLCSPDISRNEAMSVLTASVRRIEKVRIHVEKGLRRIEKRIERLLADLRIEPVEDQQLHRLERELRQVDARIRESKNRLAALRQRLKDKVQELSQRQWLHGETLPDEYSSLRTIVADMIMRNRNTLQEIQQFRTDWELALHDWVSDLENPESLGSDQHHFLGTYLASCNVIGVTCNENRRTLEEAGHTHFDVVIIDEVSKATPPELLMPIMYGRTGVLVGDHRQLPPLFKERGGSWQEAVEQEQEQLENGVNEHDTATELTRENFERYQKMVTASLFKEHFENAPQELKASLFFQYRMHPQIMDVINCFYKNRLKCGLEDADTKRDHGMTIRSPKGLAMLTPDRHAVWIDTSCEPAGRRHFEQQAGTSKINDLEAVLIVQMLARIDQECKRLGYGRTKRKRVGVISFYGRQVRHIRGMIRNHKRLHGDFEAIQCDINTVDRFQGKERPIIIVSMVRNKPIRRKSRHAYVAQFERINVALSRAQELLLVFGAKDMFFDYPVRLPNLDRPGYRARKVYQEIINRLHQNACFWESSRIMDPQEYRRACTDLLPKKAQAFRVQEYRRSRPRKFSRQPRR